MRLLQSTWQSEGDMLPRFGLTLATAVLVALVYGAARTPWALVPIALAEVASTPTRYTIPIPTDTPTPTPPETHTETPAPTETETRGPEDTVTATATNTATPTPGQTLVPTSVMHRIVLPVVLRNTPWSRAGPSLPILLKLAR